MERSFSFYPVVLAVYFVSVLGFTMFSGNPMIQVTALFGGMLLYVKNEKGNKSFWGWGRYLLLFGVIAVTNPLFSHNGVTPLFFLNGNPVTLEALLYGVHMAVTLAAVVLWFHCLNQVLTEDKLLFLFGKVSPKIALLLSTALRFVPLLKGQASKIRQSQKAMGLYASESFVDRFRGTVRVYSALLTWAFEHAIDTGASMKGRGYGLKGRSHYSLFRFQKRDAGFLLLIVVLYMVILGAMTAGSLEFAFYPAISATPVTLGLSLALAAFLILCLLPFILDVKEELWWKYYRSKI